MYIAEHIKGIVKSAFFFCHGESAIRDVLVAKGTPTREPARWLRGFF